MPAVKMKAKTTTTFKKDGNYPPVSQKSNKISKLPCSMGRVTNEKENLAISCQTSQNDICKIKESSKDHDNKGDTEQTCLSFNGCTDSIVVRDSLPSSLSSGSETMLPYFNGPNYAHCDQFEAINREQITWAPLVDDNYFNNFQMPYVLDSYAYEECQTGFPSDGTTVYDDSPSHDYLSDLVFAGTNFINSGTEGNMLFPSVAETIGAADYHYGGSYEGFQHMSDSSWFNLMCHQANLFTEELHVNSSQLGSDRVDYFDQETFVKNFLELSDEANSLPALVSQETSKKKNVTLVLDLDETLVHSTMEQCDGAHDFTFQMLMDKECTVYVRKRPFLQEFLEKVSEMFEIIIFTASKRVYAEKLLDVLDPDKKIFSRRVYRESCTWKDHRCIKDLTVLGIDLAKVFIIDNTPEVFKLQVNNGIPIKSWFDDPTDSALISLLPFLEKLVDVDDVRPFIAEKFGARN
ncbi:CTD small phosphatase protein 2 [Spatholobus suberectus]|nr:CTD small phosphatase protein 2 [Spatholobus suberectus]